MIVGAARMAHSAVEGSQASLIVRPERRGVYLFFILFTIFLQFFFGGQYQGLSQDVVATSFFLFLHT